MNLPPLIQSALQQLRQERAAETEAVSQKTRLDVGRTLMAAVTEISPLSASERQQALQNLRLELAQQAREGRLDPQAVAQLREWARQPQLNLVGLRLAGQDVYTVTPETLRLQQAVQVVARPDGQLQLITAAAPTTPDSPGVTGRSFTETAPGQWQSIAETLRATLPYQTSIKILTQLLHRFHTELAALPSPQRDAIIPVRLQQALTAVEKLAHSPVELARPEGLRHALVQSGAFLEGKLASALRQASETAGRPHKPAARPSGAQILADLQMPLARQAKAAGAPEAPLRETDLKAALLHLLQVIHTHQPPAFQQSPPKLMSGGDSLIFSLLGLLQKMPAKGKEFADTKGRLLQGLQQQVTAALAKIQTQQLQSVSQRGSEPATPGPAGYFELPVRLPDGYTSIGIQIQEYWQGDEGGEQASEDGSTPPDKVRQWEVFLEFDLGRHGQLASQLKVSQNSVSASFWAETEGAREATREGLAALRHSLEDSGLQVQEMQCLPGLPPQRAVKFNYNLVDITT